MPSTNQTTKQYKSFSFTGYYPDGTPVLVTGRQTDQPGIYDVWYDNHYKGRAEQHGNDYYRFISEQQDYEDPFGT